MAVVINVRDWLLENFVLGYQMEEKGVLEKRVSFGGINRSYSIHLPDNYDSGDKVPLVIMLHPIGANSEIMMEMTGMNQIADKNNFIVVYPNGTGLFDNYLLSWNAGVCCNYAGPVGVDDVGFIKFIIDELAKEAGEKAVVGKIDTEQEPELAEKFTIMSITTLLIFRDGKVVETLVVGVCFCR